MRNPFFTIAVWIIIILGLMQMVGYVDTKPSEAVTFADVCGVLLMAFIMFLFGYVSKDEY